MAEKLKLEPDMRVRREGWTESNFIVVIDARPRFLGRRNHSTAVESFLLSDDWMIVEPGGYAATPPERFTVEVRVPRIGERYFDFGGIVTAANDFRIVRPVIVEHPHE